MNVVNLRRRKLRIWRYGMGSGGGQSIALAYDTFTRANSATALGSTEKVGPDGKSCPSYAWSALVGTWGIGTDKGYCAIPVGNSYAVVEVGLRNISVSANMTTILGGPSGVAASVVDAGNNIIIYYDTVTFKVYKCVTTAYTEILSEAVTYVAGASVRLDINGTSVMAYYNGIQIGATLTVDDAGLMSATKAGLFTPNADTRFDNFKVFPQGVFL